VRPGAAGYYSIQIVGALAPSGKKVAELTVAALWTIGYGFVAALALVTGAWPVALATIPAFIGSRMAVINELP
jgi:hypothetical protein